MTVEIFCENIITHPKINNLHYAFKSKVLTQEKTTKRPSLATSIQRMENHHIPFKMNRFTHEDHRGKRTASPLA